MEKLFYSISEVATILGESVSLVRFWTNSFPRLLQPRRTAKGNRQYTAQEIETLRQIHYLVKVKGMTLEGAAAQMEADKGSVEKRVKALDSLRRIREQLTEIKASL